MISIREVLEACAEEIRVLAAEKSQELRLDIPADLPKIYGSASHLRQAVTNLLSNGVKYTPEQGTIILCARRTDDQVEVEVCDTGVGIDSEDLPHIFDQFYRGKGGDKAHGAGLGLSIVKRIVEAHQGTIWVESPYAAGQQTGSRFVFTLPVGQPAGLKVFGD
jgi:signal transduction histidine kinase